MVFEPIEVVPVHTIANAERLDMDCSRQVKRSLIHPQFAQRFIMSYVLDQEGGAMNGTGDIERVAEGAEGPSV